MPGASWASPAAPEGYLYVSPRPGSRLVSPRNTIVIRHGSPIDAGSLDDEAISVIGSRSGAHRGKLMLSDDSRTLVFTPRRPFALGETVRVSVAKGSMTSRGEDLPPLAFGFSVTPTDLEPQRFRAPLAPPGAPPLSSPISASAPPDRRPARPASSPCDTLPPVYPAITLLASDDPEPGQVFISPYSGGTPSGNLVILDDHGLPVFYRRVSDSELALDFKMQPNGLLT